MAKIMKANSTQSMLLEQFRKLYRQIAGLDYVSDLIYADVANVVLHVRSSAKLSVLLLLCFYGYELFLYEINKRKHPHA